MQYHNKLVRDKIPAIIQAQGRTPHTQRIEESARLSALADKLVEEAQEYRHSLTQSEEEQIEELADTLEVLDAILRHTGLTWERVQAVREQKRQQRGGFEAFIKLISVE